MHTRNKTLFSIFCFIWGGITGAAPIPSEVKSVVAFVYAGSAPGKHVSAGTGFFVGIQNPANEHEYAVYLITAKHVLQKTDRRTYHKSVDIRLNRHDGTSGSINVPIRVAGANQTVLVPTDASVDLAAIPLAPDQTVFDYKFLPSDFLTKKDDFDALQIREGSDVFFTGLFLPYPGAKKNYPIVRFGRVALITDEKIDLDGSPTDLYLVEIASFGGNSGSPVFFYLGSDRNPGSLVVGKPILKLAGVMKGTFQEAKPLTVLDTKKVAASFSTLGIAVVVPAFKVHELLYRADVSAKRGF